MALRHTTILTFYGDSLDELGITSRLGLTEKVETSANGHSPAYDHSKSETSQRFASAHNQLVRELRKGISMATEGVRIELDMDACDALIALLAELRIEGRCKDAEVFDRAMHNVQSAREHLVETADAWRGTEHMALETIYFTKYERAEVVHWMEINEDDNDNGRRDGMTDAERHADIRLHEQFAKTADHRCFTGDLETFRVLQATMEEAQEVALDRDEQGLECAELRYQALMGKIDDAIGGLETLDSDAPRLP